MPSILLFRFAESSTPDLTNSAWQLEHAAIPIVWTTSRSRAQMDEPLRKLGHRHPFIAENGCGAYIPEGYYNLKAEKTVRFGRFTCIPIAEVQPAASEALEALSEESRVPVVPLRSLSPRELAQNLNLPEREAELARQRDFDEPFFFAGASDEDIARFRAEANQRKMVLHQRGVLWSASLGGSVAQATRELSKLYQRIWRFRPSSVAIATSEESKELFPAADRRITLTRQGRWRYEWWSDQGVLVVRTRRLGRHPVGDQRAIASKLQVRPVRRPIEWKEIAL